MHQDIKTFSDLTAINTGRKLHAHMSLRRHGRTVSQVKINGWVINVDKVLFEFDLLDSLKFEINLLDFDEGTSGIEIEQFSINGLEVLPKYQHLASKPTNYIDKLGTWCLEIPSPFYVWYHQVIGQGWIA
jgi:hypothetical protein